MQKAVAYLRTHPVIALAIAAGIAAIALLVVLPQRSAPVSTPSPAQPITAAPPGPAAPAPVAPAQMTPEPSAVATPAPRIGSAVDAGRPDPFVPLVKPVAPGSGGGGGGLPPLPPAPLPPPLFPGQQPGAPGAAPPPPEPKEAGGAALVGVLGDGTAVAIIRLGKDTFIVSPGDLIMDRIRVQTIDVSKGLVILEQDGERFELKMGGVNGPHVAASASSYFH